MPFDPRVDEYIASAPSFARPILAHLRELVHSSCPDVEETIKWRRPIFLYRSKITFGMAAFKTHCGFGFWHPHMTALLAKDGFHSEESSGSIGRLTQLSDLPSKQKMLSYIEEACRLVDRGAAIPRKLVAPKPQPAVPSEFAAALAKNKTADKAFQNFSSSHRREYIEWIVEAKRDETRAKRVAAAIEWLSEGKSRNWKYENC